MYLYLFGGVYIDLDYESLKPIDDLIENRQLIFSMLTYDFKTRESFPNSLFASTRQNKFWFLILSKVHDRWQLKPDQNVNWHTGPKLLFDTIEMYLKLMSLSTRSMSDIIPQQEDSVFDIKIFEISFLPPSFVNAYDWTSMKNLSSICSPQYFQTFDTNKCKQELKPKYAITYWSHTHGNGHQNDENYLQ